CEMYKEALSNAKKNNTSIPLPLAEISSDLFNFPSSVLDKLLKKKKYVAIWQYVSSAQEILIQEEPTRKSFTIASWEKEIESFIETVKEKCKQYPELIQFYTELET